MRGTTNINTKVNGSSFPTLLNPTADKILQIFSYCLILAALLVGHSVVGIIVYKTTTLRKSINYFIANMAMSDLLYPISLFPLKITELFVDSWLIGGPLGQAFCKLPHFLTDVSTLVSVQSLFLIAVDRFVAVVFPLRSPLSTMGNQLSASAISGTNIKQNRWFQPALKPGKILVLVKQNVPKPNQRPLIRLFFALYAGFLPNIFRFITSRRKEFHSFRYNFSSFFLSRGRKRNNSLSFLLTCQQQQQQQQHLNFLH